MYRFMFAVQNINNGTLNSKGAMPQKDSTSNDDSNFSIPRREYVESYYPTTGNNKKWYGGQANRDSSQITHNRRVHEIANGTLNANNTPLSFTTNTDINVVRNAKHRVRSGGARVPAQARYNYSGAPVFY
jgi:hypothetical protein